VLLRGVFVGMVIGGVLCSSVEVWVGQIIGGVVCCSMGGWSDYRRCSVLLSGGLVRL